MNNIKRNDLEYTAPMKFLQNISKERNGALVVIGTSGSGKSTLMNKYLSEFWRCSKKSVITRLLDPVYIGNNLEVYETLSGVEDDAINSDIVIFDDADNDEVRTALLMAGEQNVGIIPDDFTIVDFIKRFRETEEFVEDGNLMLDRINGVLCLFSRYTTGERVAFAEFISFDKESVKKLLETDESELEKLVESLIESQNGVPIRKQVCSMVDTASESDEDQF